MGFAPMAYLHPVTQYFVPASSLLPGTLPIRVNYFWEQCLTQSCSKALRLDGQLSKLHHGPWHENLRPARARKLEHTSERALAAAMPPKTCQQDPSYHLRSLTAAAIS